MNETTARQLKVGDIVATDKLTIGEERVGMVIRARDHDFLVLWDDGGYDCIDFSCAQLIYRATVVVDSRETDEAVSQGAHSPMESA